jgi:phosphoribosylglycinamide formyltransferase-1
MACRVVVLISGSGSNLQALIDGQADNSLAISIEAVISNKESVYGLTRADEAKIPNQVIQHNAFPDRESYDQALIAAIDQYNPDLVVLAGFMRILSAPFVNHYAERLLNIHPSLLPKYQGLNTHQRAIDAGDQWHGVTVHFVSEELDGGPSIIQARVPIEENDTVAKLSSRVQVQEHIIYPLAISWFADKRLSLKENRVYLDDRCLPSSGYQYSSSELEGA